MSTPLIAQLSRSCCDGRGQVGSTTGAHWKVYVPILGSVREWPEYRWQGRHRRHVIPTPKERAAALAELGYQVVSDAEWRWIEDEGPGYHGHASQVILIGSIDIVPLDQTGGQR